MIGLHLRYAIVVILEDRRESQPSCDGSGEIDRAEEVGGYLVVARGDATEVLEVAEHAVDRFAPFVEGLGEAAFPAAVCLGRNVRNRTLALNEIANRVGVIGFIAEHDGLGHKIVQQDTGRPAIGDLAAGQQKAQWSAFAVDECIELAVATATADPDRLDERHLISRPPPAEQCAFMWVLSIRTSAGGPPAAASVANSSRQTPFAAQRTKRL